MLARRELFAKLMRADALHEERRYEDAAVLLEETGDAYLDGGDVLGALVAFRRALGVRGAQARDRAAQVRVSLKWSGAYTTLRVDEAEGFDPSRLREILAVAARSLGGEAPDQRSHRALCERCGAFKGAYWLRCDDCGEPAASACGPLLSERIWSRTQLGELAERLKRGEGHGIPGDFVTVFLKALTQGFARHRAWARLVEDPVPGTVYAATKDDGTVGVLMDLRIAGAEGATRPEVGELLSQLGNAALRGDYAPDINPLADESVNPHRIRRQEVEQRTGERLRLERWERLVAREQGVVGAFLWRHAVPLEAKRRIVWRGASRAGALVGLDASAACSDRRTLVDLAELLAVQVTLTDPLRLPSPRAPEAALSGLHAAPFQADPTLCIRDALDLVGELVGASVAVSGYVRYALPAAPSAPDRFPGEAARRQSG